MKNLLMVLVLAMSGCCAYPGQVYVEADEATYIYASPKLKEWAEAKGGDWPTIVKNKDISWKARIERAKAKAKEEAEAANNE
jgi:hypothetical protein